MTALVHAFMIDPMFVPVSIARHAAAMLVPQMQQVVQPVQTTVPISPTDGQLRAGPVARPLNVAGTMMTEADKSQLRSHVEHIEVDPFLTYQMHTHFLYRS